MADIVIPFFNPTDIMSLAASGWVQQSNGLVTSHKRASGPSAIGDEAAHKMYGGEERGSVPYKCYTESGNLTLPKVGLIVAHHLDNWSLAYDPNGWAGLTCNVHQHDSNAHAAGGLNLFTSPLTLPAQWGIPRSFGGFVLNTAACGVESLTITFGCTHVDKDENGEHLAAENRDGVMVVTWGFTGVPASITVPDGWEEMSDGSPKSNTDAQTTQMSWEYHVARD